MSQDLSRREFNTAVTAAFLSQWFGDDDEDAEDGSAGLGDLGFFDDLGIAEDGEEVARDPDWLDVLGSALTVTRTTKGVELEFDESELDIDGLTNPLTGTFDANGEDIENVGSIDTGEQRIEWWSNGFDRTIFVDDDTSHIAAINRKGEIVAGGPESVNVSDATDFAEVLAEAINGHEPNHTAVKLGSQVGDGSFACKSTQTIDSVFALFGSGKNRTNVGIHSSLEGETVFTCDFEGSPQYITRMADIKWTGDPDAKPDRIWYFNDMWEILLTDVEFKRAESYGIQCDNVGTWNYITNCWFLEGAGLRIDNATDMRLIGNRFAANCELEGISELIRRGNEIDDDGSLTITDCEFHRPDEAFGRVNSRHVSENLSRSHDDTSVVEIPVPDQEDFSIGIERCRTNNDGDSLYLQLYDDTAGEWITGYNVNREQRNSDGENHQDLNAEAADQIEIAADLSGWSSRRSGPVEITINRPQDSAYTTIDWNGTLIGSDEDAYRLDGSAIVPSDAVVTEARLFEGPDPVEGVRDVYYHTKTSVGSDSKDVQF